VKYAVPMIEWLAERRSDVYPENRTTLHDTVTEQMLGQVLTLRPLPSRGRILDVGCGQAVAMDKLRDLGHWVLGITLGTEDALLCASAGHSVLIMDQTFLGLRDEAFDLIWCRHALEHAVAPRWTLHQLYRCLRPDGSLYVEVPAPDTGAHHEVNPNHYSVLSRLGWVAALQYSGFVIANDWVVQFPMQKGGLDTYWGFLCHKA